jgi:uncharacterized alkaline shock family protein YloU
MSQGTAELPEPAPAPGPASTLGRPPGPTSTLGRPPGPASTLGRPPGPAPAPGPASTLGRPPGPASTRGETVIAPAVVEKIATRAASEVDGVGGVVETGLGRLLPWTVGHPSAARASAEVGAETVSVNLTVNVVYPEPVAAVTNRVRAQVTRRLAELCGLRAAEVNIAVPALVTPPRVARRRVE